MPCEDAKLILSQYLWYNNVLKKNKPFILQEFMGRGIKYLCNLIGPCGYFKIGKSFNLIEFDLEVNNLVDWYVLFNLKCIEK